jgi:flagellar L-ring protein precursor FlgH
MTLRINHHTALWTIFLGIAIAGCAPKVDHLSGDLEFPAAPVAKADPGSIWPGESAANMLFTDKKARYEGDIVTIIITESSQGGNNATTDTSRETSVNAGIDALLGLD